MAPCFRWLALLLPVLLAGCPSRAAIAPPAQPRRPNFVFILTDDQRWDALGVVQREQGDRARFPWFRTPHLDRLAAEGARFRNAFVVNSLCSPSRASFLTGQYGHKNGIIDNHTPFPAGSVTSATLLRPAGYSTGYFGKWHMGPQSGPRPGFGVSASFVGQGRYDNCPIEINGKSTPTQGWVDDVTTGYAVDFIGANKDRPFFLVLGLKAAHGPFEPPACHKDTFAGEQARPVPNLAARAIYLPKPAAGEADKPARPGTNLNYFRCLAAADDNVGRVLHALDQHQLADDTLVVFAGDNGFYLGEHGLGDKRSAYEESLRIPLLVRYPRLAAKGRLVDGLALNIDLAPTLLDLAGVPVPRAMQGRSWRPLLEGKTDGWRDSFFYAYFYENPFRVPTVTAVRTATVKLVRYPGHDEWTELFDLAQDPYEQRNLYQDPAHAGLRQRLEQEYDKQKAAVDFRVPPWADDPKDAAPRPPLKARVLDFQFDKDEGDKVVDASGKGNHGKAVRAPLTEGRDGRKARRFDGTGRIDIPKSPSLNPAVSAWTVEATFRTDKPQGVVAACGGQANGWCLHLDQGRPVFTVVSMNRASRVAGPEGVVGRWVTVAARITADQHLTLTVDGKPAGRARLHEWIARQPNDAQQVGTDTGSPVDEAAAKHGFVGLIESMRFYSGDAP